MSDRDPEDWGWALAQKRYDFMLRWRDIYQQRYRRALKRVFWWRLAFFVCLAALLVVAL